MPAQSRARQTQLDLLVVAGEPAATWPASSALRPTTSTPPHPTSPQPGSGSARGVHGLGAIKAEGRGENRRTRGGLPPDRGFGLQPAHPDNSGLDGAHPCHMPLVSLVPCVTSLPLAVSLALAFSPPPPSPSRFPSLCVPRSRVRARSLFRSVCYISVPLCVSLSTRGRAPRSGAP